MHNSLLRNLSLTFLVSAVITASGCLHFGGQRSPAGRSSAPVQTVKKEILAEDRDETTPMTKLEAHTNDLLLSGNFEQLDQIAHSKRNNKDRLRGGTWQLESIYRATSTFYKEYDGQRVTDELWQARIELLRSWKEKFPSSVTARVALANVYLDYAWFARGSGTIDTVSESDLRLMRERLNKANEELLAALDSGMYCPGLYSQLLYLRMVDGSDRSEFDKIFNEAIRKEPNYITFYQAKAEAVKEKWGGGSQDWQHFVDSLPEQLAAVGSDEIDIIYFIIVADKLQDHTFVNNWAILSKDRIRNGFKEIEEKYTPSNYRLNQFAYIMSVLRLTDEAKAAFKRIGNDRNEAVWNEKLFTTIKKSIEAQRPQPQRSQKPLKREIL